MNRNKLAWDRTSQKRSVDGIKRANSECDRVPKAIASPAPCSVA